MVRDRVADGVRIAQLLSSEIDGREDGHLSRLAVVDPADATGDLPDGERVYGIECEGERYADVFVHDDRVRIELRENLEEAARLAPETGLRVRPKATDPPRLLLFVESGAAVKRAVDVLDGALAESN